jgi:predicted regulator of amino acid metabolism with ACT domain
MFLRGASSTKAFENSITVIEKEARQEDFEKFKEAYRALALMKIAIANVYSGAELDVDSEVNALFDGKTPNEIIKEFERK